MVDGLGGQDRAMEHLGLALEMVYVLVVGVGIRKVVEMGIKIWSLVLCMPRKE